MSLTFEPTTNGVPSPTSLLLLIGGLFSYRLATRRRAG
jgi:hypothetical protein